MILNTKSYGMGAKEQVQQRQADIQTSGGDTGKAHRGDRECLITPSPTPLQLKGTVNILRG